MELLVELGFHDVQLVVFLVRDEHVPREIHVLRVEFGLVGKVGKVSCHDAVWSETPVMRTPRLETPVSCSCAGNPAQGSSAFWAERGSTLTYRSGVRRN